MDYINNPRVLFNKNEMREWRNKITRQQWQHRKLLSFSQSQTQPGFLRTTSYSGITCDILRGDGESRELPAPLVTVWASKKGIARGHPQRFIGELSQQRALGTRCWGSKMVMAMLEEAFASRGAIYSHSMGWRIRPSNLGAAQTRRALWCCSDTSHESTINTLKAAGKLPGSEQCCPSTRVLAAEACLQIAAFGLSLNSCARIFQTQ